MLHVISHGITPQGGIICSYFTPMTLPIAMPFIWIKFHHLISHQTWQLTISCHKVRCTDLLIINNGWIISEKKIAATTTKTSQYVVSFFLKKKKKTKYEISFFFKKKKKKTIELSLKFTVPC